MREGLQLVVAQLGADGDVVDGGERRCGARGFDALAGVLAQAGDVAEAETESQGVRGYGVGGSRAPLTP